MIAKAKTKHMKHCKAITYPSGAIKIPPKAHEALDLYVKLARLYESRMKRICKFLPTENDANPSVLTLRKADEKAVEESHRADGRKERYGLYLLNGAPAVSFHAGSLLMINHLLGKPDTVIGPALAKHLEEIGEAFLKMARDLRADIKKHPEAWKPLPTYLELAGEKESALTTSAE